MFSYLLRYVLHILLQTRLHIFVRYAKAPWGSGCTSSCTSTNLCVGHLILFVVLFLSGEKKKIFQVVQENAVNHMDLLSVTSFSSHLSFGWKKVIKVFQILEALHSNGYPMNLLLFLFAALGKRVGNQRNRIMY